MGSFFILLGYMGCGKSELGKKISISRSIPFIDLDHFIEEQTEADFEIKFTELKKKELHKGIGCDQLETYSEQLKRLAIAVKALSKINQHTPFIGDN